MGIWKHSEQPCGTRLKQTLPLWLNSYQARHGSLEAFTYQKILTYSPRTLDRITAPIALRVAAASDAKPVEPATGSKNSCRSAVVRKPSTSRVDSKPTPSRMVHILSGILKWSKMI